MNRGQEPLMRAPREVGPDDKVIESSKVLDIRVALGRLQRNEQNSSTIDKVEIMLDLLRDRGFASPTEIMGLNADLVGLGMAERLEV